MTLYSLLMKALEQIRGWQTYEESDSKYFSLFGSFSLCSTTPICSNTILQNRWRATLGLWVGVCLTLGKMLWQFASLSGAVTIKCLLQLFLEILTLQVGMLQPLSGRLILGNKVVLRLQQKSPKKGGYLWKEELLTSQCTAYNWEFYDTISLKLSQAPDQSRVNPTENGGLYSRATLKI